ncbi:MAG TPA: EAL domain-containing protein [Propylenella sp.]|nr:EAL domain-containing protein [Propylenella sp.]
MLAAMGLSDETADDGPSSRTAVFNTGWMRRVADATQADKLTAGADRAALEIVKLRGLFRTAFSYAPIGMALADAAGRVVIANDALCRLTGRTADELGMRTVAEIVLPEDRHELDGDRARRLSNGEVASYEATVRLRRADGGVVWVAMTASRDGPPEPATYIYQFQDISERRQLEVRLQYLVDHDLLTGVFNRRRFDQELARQIERQQRFGELAAVLMMDLDGFKGVNDQYGHAVGDELLRGLAATLRQRTRETDVLARLGGDEFVLLLPGADRASAEVVAAELVTLVREHVSALGSDRARVTASVGVVTLFDTPVDGGIVALADAAMYAAKEAGGDRYVVLDPADPRPPRSAQAGEASRLRQALANDGLVLHAQPVWNLAEHRVEMYELLVRMRDENSDELIVPNAFLYAAERFGLMTAIDSWVISQAVQLIAEQARHGRRVVLSVNLSGRSIGDPELDAQIDRALKTSGIDPSCLVFELTETAAIRNIEAAIAFSRRLQRLSCRFALDDFGAGFASFFYLKRLPFDLLKIDGDFVRDLAGQAGDRVFINAIVTIARGMGKKTIAEFVTDQATSDVLLASGVDYAQGFHFARPAPALDVLHGSTLNGS